MISCLQRHKSLRISCQAFEIFDSSCVFYLRESKEKIHMVFPLNRVAFAAMHHTSKPEVFS